MTFLLTLSAIGAVREILSSATAPRQPRAPQPPAGRRLDQFDPNLPGNSGRPRPFVPR